MKLLTSFLICFSIFTLTCSGLKAQTTPTNPASFDRLDPWSANQLIEPAALASALANKSAKQPLIYNIGVTKDIKGAQNLGASSEEENLNKFKRTLDKLPKNTSLVIYCGCCPFNKCPNIRPAFQALKDKGFTNARLLNLSQNLKTNWIDKGYPLAENN